MRKRYRNKKKVLFRTLFVLDGGTMVLLHLPRKRVFKRVWAMWEQDLLTRTGARYHI